MADVEVGPLDPGTYRVVVEWQHVDDSDFPSELDPNHGMGELEFTVVPEPIGAPLAALGSLGLLAVARRRRGRRGLREISAAPVRPPPRSGAQAGAASGSA